MKLVTTFQWLYRGITAVAMIAILLSCNNDPKSGHDHDHEGDHEHEGEHDHDHAAEEAEMAGLSYTLYSEKTELFVEFPPLIIGSEVNLVSHLTVLGEIFKPLIEGSVTVTLDVNGKKTTNTASSPEVPGIFHLTLTPERIGMAKLTFDITTPGWTDQIIIPNLQVFADNKSASSGLPEQAHYTGTTPFLKEQAWVIEFANTPVQRIPFRDIIKTSGKILSAPGDEMLVTAGAGGVVLFNGNNTIIGSAVSNGTQMFTISSSGLSEGNFETEYKRLKANRDKTKIDYDRASELVKSQIISEKDFQQIKLDYENAQSAFNTLDKNYSAKGISVASPITGFVRNILVTEGQYVESGTPLAIVSGNKTLLLQAIVSQKYFQQLPTITSANFQTAESNEIHNTEDLDGKVISYGKGTSSNSPFLTVTFEINNILSQDDKNPLFIPGSAAEVYLQSKTDEEALVIPVSSLLEEQGSFFVYVQLSGETFQKRQIKPGTSDGTNIQVLSGLEEGERVVNLGAYQLKLSSASGALPAHSHEH